MEDVVVVGYARTPVGRFGGALAALPAAELGGRAIEGALECSGIRPDRVGYVVLGHVLQAGQGQLPTRQAAVAAGIPMTVPAETINKVCLSGMTAISRARDLIRLGEFDVVVAGGMESMSNAPYLLDRARFGYRMGDGTLRDTLSHDGLTCAFDGCAMGAATDRYQRDKGLAIDREQQDAWAVRSHQRAERAWQDGRFADEVVAVDVPQRRGGPVRVTQDEGVRSDVSSASLAALAPVFDADDGTITAGNAAQISDGAAAVVLASRSAAQRHGLEVLASIMAWGTVAGPDPSLHLQPAAAIHTAAARAGMDPGALDRYEINEAFASVAIASTRELGVPEDVVNVNGGGVALGHPIGSSGARIVVTLVNELRRYGGGRGAAALCGGGGQGDALLVEVG